MSKPFRPFDHTFWTLLLFTTALIAGCSGTTGAFCQRGGIAAVSDQLYFGMEKPGGIITEPEWRQFLQEVVTPRFPKGFTWWLAEGQWREADGRITREVSRVLQVIHPGSGDADGAVAEIIRQYKEKFNQTSVLHMRSTACISF